MKGNLYSIVIDAPVNGDNGQLHMKARVKQPVHLFLGGSDWGHFWA